MKRYISMALLLLFLPIYVAKASPAFLQQSDEKSEIERYMQQVAKIRSSQIDYAYISTSMFKKMFAMVGGEIKMQGVGNILGTIKSLRRFETTGPEGYTNLLAAMQLFLEEEQMVMGMELFAMNRSEGSISIIYGNETCVLMINNQEDGSQLSVVFVVGIDYSVFMNMLENGIELGF
jgi:hypothetical protein